MHTIRSWLLVLLLAFVALAAPIPAQAEALRPAATVQSAQILDEQAFGGPALWTNGSLNTDPIASTATAVLAWTGRNTAHNVNLMTSRDGITFGDKVVLPYSALAGPAVMVYHLNGLDHTLVAWPGPKHQLHLLFDAYGFRRLYIVGDTSDSAPALTQDWNGRIWMAWTGRDSHRSLNVMPLTLTSSNAVHFGGVTTLSAYSSQGHPSLATDFSNRVMLLSWTDTGASDYLPARQHFINLLTSSDGRTWQLPMQTPPLAFSNVGPNLLVTSPSGQNVRYTWCWKGTNRSDSINGAVSASYTSWDFTARTVLNEQTYSSPACGQISSNSHYVVAWTGINPGRNLNVATINPSNA